ncbi:MAG: ribonuclease P protein component [Balneola sp.]|jgi:ribonuclease P protein component
MSEKGQSNITVAPPRRFTLPKSRILRGKRNFQNLFSGTALIKSPSVNLRYTTFNTSEWDFKIGFISPKKTGNAVQRNNAKRVMRESFRLNQHEIIQTVQELGVGLHCVLIARNTNLRFAEVQTHVVTMLDELRNRLLSTNQTI